MGLREVFSDLFGLDPDKGHSVPTCVRTPDGSNRPITLVLDEHGAVWWEYADTEGEG